MESPLVLGGKTHHVTRSELIAGVGRSQLSQVVAVQGQGAAAAVVFVNAGLG